MTDMSGRSLIGEGRPTAQAIELPAPSPNNGPQYGSDLVAETLRALDIPYVALNPGASFRGLHDSLVNHLGNQHPSLMLCLHEEHAVAIAHGWAKVTGVPMAAAVHSNVGLFHATMAVFNAWCDRMPMIVIGATGPVDASQRRPWIDWIHTARDQGAIVRPYVKWDDQPASAIAAREALLRAAFIASSVPMGPTYINLDAGMQEARLIDIPPSIDTGRYVPNVATAAPDGLIREALEILGAADRPLILMGRVSRSEAAWESRVALAEYLGARVITDLKLGASFPTDHELHAGTPGVYVTPEAARHLSEADAIISLDWVDLAGTLSISEAAPASTIIHCTLDHHLHNGWSMDHQGLPPVDLLLLANPDAVVSAMLDQIGVGPVQRLAQSKASRPLTLPPPSGTGPVSVEALALGLRHAVGDRETSLLHLPLSWNGAWWPFRHPLDYLGSDGGGGIGGGPGISVGAALALRDGGKGRLPISIVGDGDFLMGATAIWTAVHYRIPLLMVVANNQSFFNDEVHQERMAHSRGRPVENKWIGQRMSDPEIDLAGMGRSQGALGVGPIVRPVDLIPAFQDAIKVVESGGVAVVDVRVEPGYTPAMTASLGRHGR